ncbi:MAG: DUF4252 domain-containing protein [Terracidiphilus sp.]
MNRSKVATRIGALALIVLGLALLARAQDGLPLPSPVEKELAARAVDVTEVTLDKNMLGFAAQFMKGKDEDAAHARKLISGLQGIYVREYEFDKDGQYSMDDVARLRAQFETPEWSPVVRERERKSNETTDVMMKMVNGEPQGIFVLDAESRELTIVLILGPIRMEDLGALSGLSGLGALGDIEGTHHAPQGNDKSKPADKKGDDQ